ncbi:hypothetical protein HS121_12045 [bacterium]|nr:hypothetical protein [bacterium]
MSTTDRYEANGDWSGLSAWRSSTGRGWIIEGWSRVQGDRTQARYFIPDSLVNLEEPLDREDLCLLWEMRDQGKCLQKGILVE